MFLPHKRQRWDGAAASVVLDSLFLLVSSNLQWLPRMSEHHFLCGHVTNRTIQYLLFPVACANVETLQGYSKRVFESLSVHHTMVYPQSALREVAALVFRHHSFFCHVLPTWAVIQQCVDVGRFGWDRTCIWNFVLPLDVKYSPQTCHVEVVKLSGMSAVYVRVLQAWTKALSNG